MTCFIRKIGNGPALVFIHGFGFNHKIWLEQIVSHYEATHTCYLIDLPGFGESEHHRYTLTDLVDILMSQLPKQFAVCGWSLGGLIGLKMALEHPDRTTKLLTISTDPGFGEENVGLNHQEMNVFHQTVLADKDKAMRRFLHLQFSKNGFDKTAYQFLLAMMKPLPTQEALTWGIDLLSETRLGDQLTYLKVPSVFLYGDEDKIVSPNTHGKIVSMNQTNLQSHLITEAGHILVFTHYQIVIDLLEDMI